ncbi:MAG: hypothetical protein ACOX57_00850 [Limnochordia bacterium]
MQLQVSVTFGDWLHSIDKEFPQGGKNETHILLFLLWCWLWAWPSTPRFAAVWPSTWQTMIQSSRDDLDLRQVLRSAGSNQPADYCGGIEGQCGEFPIIWFCT